MLKELQERDTNLCLQALLAFPSLVTGPCRPFRDVEAIHDYNDLCCYCLEGCAQVLLLEAREVEKVGFFKLP